MIRMIHIAPFCDRARNLPPFSTCGTARIQCSGAPRRLDASVTKSAKGLLDISLARCMAGNARWACAEPLNSIDDAKIATIHTTPAKNHNATIVLAVKGGGADALA
jgi:hypothetical protein